MTEGRTEVGPESDRDAEVTGALSPEQQSEMHGREGDHVTLQMPVLEQRESYADLVKRLEMDEDEDSQDWQESAGSMVSQSVA